MAEKGRVSVSQGCQSAEIFLEHRAGELHSLENRSDAVHFLHGFVVVAPGGPLGPAGSGDSLKDVLASPVDLLPTMAGMDLPGLTETQILTKAYFAWNSKSRPGRRSSEELHETVFTLGKGKPYCNGGSSLVPSPLLMSCHHPLQQNHLPDGVGP